MIAERVDTGITVWSKRLGLVLLGWFGSSAYHGTLTAHKAVIALPAIVAQANCERHLKDKAVGVAKQAIVSANSDTIPIPDIKTVPQKDNCPKPIVPSLK